MRLPIASVLMVAACLSACSSTPPAAGPAASARATAPVAPMAPAAPSGAGASTAGITPGLPPAGTALPAHLDPASPISRERSVYFDYDDDTIQPPWRPVIERQGRYLAANPALNVTVEGNTDERGGREYNLALGQRRAESVRRALLIFGVRSTQVEAVSLGEERPSADGHDERAWQQNRRADLVYGTGR